MDWLTSLIDFLVKGGPISLSIGFNVAQSYVIVWLYRDSQKRYERLVERYEAFLDQNTTTLATVLDKVLHEEEDEDQRDRTQRSIRESARKACPNPLIGEGPKT